MKNERIAIRLNLSGIVEKEIYVTLQLKREMNLLTFKKWIKFAKLFLFWVCEMSVWTYTLKKNPYKRDKLQFQWQLHKLVETSLNRQ